MTKRPDVQATAVPPEVGAKIGFYVYLLIDPFTDVPFYVGMGQKSRVLQHLRNANFMTQLGLDSPTKAKVRAIQKKGRQPAVDIVAHGLRDAREAQAVEAALIATLPNLTNRNLGNHRGRGRASLDQVITRYGTKKLTATSPPVLLIRLGEWKNEKRQMEPGGRSRSGHGWKPDITDAELLDSVRAWWIIDPKRVSANGIQHAVAVHEGVTRAVFRIVDDSWQKRGGRWLFEAKRLRSGKVVDAYLGSAGKRIEFPRYAQRPIFYWPFER